MRTSPVNKFLMKGAQINGTFFLFCYNNLNYYKIIAFKCFKTILGLFPKNFLGGDRFLVYFKIFKKTNDENIAVDTFVQETFKKNF